MIGDAKLVLDAGTTEITTDRVSTVLDIGEINDMGKTGSPLYVNLYLTAAFSSDTETVSVVLVAKNGSDPAKTDVIMTLLPPTAASSLGTVGFLARYPLPMDALDGKDRVATALVLGGTTASGKILQKITL